ncbi:unnamed protein product [Zymoseptoria tritici ST99CH_3D7]|uniref:Uncharacterized protein n=1 Tax=Zymoseptoria tritici (strain ST99CH_3D7) TaxID=1276538 RepID=A0A1X7SA83_ZYMT9|nr:unnamed protein product [Zymoseptoria tritici ST99CH_3D7]
MCAECGEQETPQLGSATTSTSTPAAPARLSCSPLTHRPVPPSPSRQQPHPPSRQRPYSPSRQRPLEVFPKIGHHTTIELLDDRNPPASELASGSKDDDRNIRRDDHNREHDYDDEEQQDPASSNLWTLHTAVFIAAPSSRSDRQFLFTILRIDDDIPVTRN